jgi:hypothetical protein
MMSEKYNEEIGEELEIMHIRNASRTFKRKIWQFLFVAIVSTNNLSTDPWLHITALGGYSGITVSLNTQLHAMNLKISGETRCGGGGWGWW